mmetsp:Transcript_91896/g.287627  ORF Transcript_91896/g.287627 Transcript_91896/m.287627 type:complete len:304 (+) Transcript_91896:648-1559(+)
MAQLHFRLEDLRLAGRRSPVLDGQTGECGARRADQDPERRPLQEWTGLLGARAQGPPLVAPPHREDLPRGARASRPLPAGPGADVRRAGQVQGAVCGGGVERRDRSGDCVRRHRLPPPHRHHEVLHLLQGLRQKHEDRQVERPHRYADPGCGPRRPGAGQAVQQGRQRKEGAVGAGVLQRLGHVRGAGGRGPGGRVRRVGSARRGAPGPRRGEFREGDRAEVRPGEAGQGSRQEGGEARRPGHRAGQPCGWFRQLHGAAAGRTVGPWPHQAEPHRVLRERLAGCGCGARCWQPDQHDGADHHL